MHILCAAEFCYMGVKYGDMLTPIGSTVIAASISYLVYKKFFQKLTIAPKRAPYKTDHEKDVVYLYQFKRLQNCPSFSSFCMKIEVLCRAWNIPYVICDQKQHWSRNGTLPFIELNGEHIADSVLIEHRLKKHFNIPSLPPLQEAQALALSKLVENHLYNILIRYKSEVDEYYHLILDLTGIPKLFYSIVLPVLKPIVYNKIYKKSKLAIGDFDPEDMKELFYTDLHVIREYLGDQRFLFGDQLHPVDATVFSHLASVYYPFRNVICEVLELEFPTILQYMERVRHQIYPDDFTL